MELNKKKIFIMVIPETGHINPLIGLANELVTKRNCQVTFYANEEHKELIERTGSIFREYKYMPREIFRPLPVELKDYDTMANFFRTMINVSYSQVPYLMEEVEKFKPDLIIYDHLCFPAKYMMRVLQSRYKKGVSKTIPPLGVHFFTCFASKKNLYPTQQQLNKLLGPGGFWHAISLIILFIKQIIFSLKFGIGCYNPIDLVYHFEENLNLVSVFPELHPEAENFGSLYKFVGCCISEKVRNYDLNDTELKEILNTYEPINPIDSIDSIKNYTDKKLIYVSMGTVFNNNIETFDKIIEAISLLNEKHKFQAVISVGKETYIEFEKRHKTENYILPKNILIRDRVPQIEILKRASLFITHCGMNSTSEAIYYAVQMICLPVDADQPLVAHRVADQLKLGIRLETESFTPEILKNSIVEIITDKSYTERIVNFSKISRKYNGDVNSADIILDYMENSNKKSK